MQDQIEFLRKHVLPYIFFQKTSVFESSLANCDTSKILLMEFAWHSSLIVR